MSLRNKIFIIILPIMLFGIFFPAMLGNSFLYFIKGSSLKIGDYEVDFPFAYWAYFGENEYAYILSGKKVNGKFTKVEIIKRPKDFNTLLLVQKCSLLKNLSRKYKYISGKAYICDDNNKSTMYFMSDRMDFILNTDNNFDYKNKEEINEYVLLLNSIKKIEESNNSN